MAAWQAAMQSLVELYIVSLITGLAGAVNETIVQMTIADVFFVHKRGVVNGAYVILKMVGSFLTPMAAGTMAANGDWRRCFWLIFAFTGAIFLYFCFAFEESKYLLRLEARPELNAAPETPRAYANGVLKKASYENLTIGETMASTSDGIASSQTPTHIDPNIPVLTWSQRMRLITRTDENMFKIVYEPFYLLFRFPAVTYTALQYGFILCWVSAQASIISIVFAQPPYSFGSAGIGNMSLGIFVGDIFGILYGGYLSDKAVRWLARRNYGYFEPEMRLKLCHLPALALGGGMFMFGITAAKVL
ncbi:hypothetical protein ACHAPJ_012372 [Fusarium lateritium]